MSEEYPDRIQGKIVMTKSSDNIYLEFHPDIPKKEMENFYEEKKDLLEIQTRPAAIMRRKLLVRKLPVTKLPVTQFRKSAIKTKNIFFFKKSASIISFNEEIKKLEQDNRVLAVRPIYYREDLKYSNSFTFKNEIIVKFNDDIDQEEMKKYSEELRIEKVRDLGNNISLFKITNMKDNVLKVIEKLKKREKIEFVNINWIQMHNPLCGSVNAEYFDQQWNLKKIEVEDAWDISKGSPLVVIAIIDTGCDLEHPSLLPQLVQSDRWHDFINNGNQPVDVNGHGTMCSGVAAALPNSRALTLEEKEHARVAGVGYNCRIMPIRIFELDDDMDEPKLDALRIIDALNFARCVDSWETPTSNWKSPKHAHILSMSFSYGGADTEAIDEILEECHKAGMVLIASAGNFGKLMPDFIDYPACNNNVIAVGASDENDERCLWNESGCLDSQYGKELCVVAPGIKIYGPDLRGNTPTELMDKMRNNGMGDYVPNKLLYGFNNFWDYFAYFDYDNASDNKPQPSRQNIGDPAGDYYFEFKGTSASTPHVAGLAGLILAYNPELSPDQVRQIIEKTSEKVGNPINGYDGNGWSKYMGFGRINAKEALEEVKKNYPYQPADVYIRKSMEDVGVEPFNGTQLCNSPDIIVLTKTARDDLGDPQATYANKNLKSNNNELEIGKENYIYIRVHNKGTKKSNIHVRLYSAPYVSRYLPERWEYFNQYDFYDVASGATVVSDAITCKDLNGSNLETKFCIIASIEGFCDSHPDPVDLSVIKMKALIRSSNNLSIRKITLK